MKTKKNLSELSKKELKDFVNSQGFFCTLDLETNAPVKEIADKVPEGASYFKGIASTEELNRNGYIIRLDAWKGSIKQFFKEGAVVLLQHEMKEPVGKLLSAEVTDKGLEVEGYVFDDLTENRFGRGLINALSTGHLTLDFEFENVKTHEVLKRQEFDKLPYEEKYSDAWVMAVTKLEWVELSLVSVGSNRKSLITNKEVIKNYIESMQTNEEEVVEPVVEPEMEEVVEEKPEPEVKETIETPAEINPEPEHQEGENKESGENPDAVVENPEKEVATNSPDLVQVSKSEFDEAQNAIKQLAELATSQKNQIEKLQAQLDSIPAPKGLVRTTVNSTPQKEEMKKPTPVADLLRANGFL